MRILNLFFKNINSLAGEGRIYFDQGPIAESGVFAITGPNGSGKTSILDIITLGLYGETFRFDKPAVHVMTKQTRECFAQVEFALGDDKYRANWEVKYDDIQQTKAPMPTMSLSQINDQEQLLADTPNQVRNKIAELTGMDFHKFSKSIVLPQGDFAAFLNALDSERMDILEKISGKDLYTDYRQQTETRFSQGQTRLRELQQDLNTLPLLDNSALEAAAEDLQDFKDQIIEYKQQQRQTQEQLTNLDNIAQLEHQQRQLQSQQLVLAKKIEHSQKDLQRIVDSQEALPFRSNIALLDSKQVLVEQQQATLDSYRKELLMLQQQLGQESDQPPLTSDKSLAEQKQVIDNLKLSVSELKSELPRQRELAASIQQELNVNRSGLAELDIWLQSHQADAILLNDFPDVVRLRNLRTERIQLSGKQKSQDNWTKKTTAGLKKNQSALQTIKTELTDLKERIAADQQTLLDIAQGRSFDELKELQQEQQLRVNDLKELFALAEVTAKLTDKGFFSWLGIKKNTEVPPNIVELESRLNDLKQEMSREENIIKVLEQALRNEALIKKMGIDRPKLVDGSPCFLCGSTAHPFVLKPPVFSDAKKALTDQRGKIQALKTKVDSASTQFSAAQKFGSKLSAKQQRLIQMHSQWTTLASRLNIMHNHLEIGDLSRQKALLLEETEELTKISNLVKQHAQLQRNIAKMNLDIETKQALLEKLTKTVEGLEHSWNNKPADFDEIEQNFAKCIAEEKTLTEKLEQQLSSLGEKLPPKGKEDKLYDRLTSRRQDYQIYLLRQQGLQKDLLVLTEQLQNSDNKIAAYQQQISSSLESLSQQERLGIHIAIIEKQKLIADQDQHWRVAQIEYKTIFQTLEEKIAGSHFASLDELKSLLHLIDEESQIRQALDSANTKWVEIEQQLQSLSTRLADESATANHLSQTELQQLLSETSQKIDIVEQEIFTLQNKLDKQQQYRERYQTILLEAEQQQLVFAQAEADMKLIQEDPAGFRQHIQQLMIDRLLSQTNQILEKLSGRYYVRSGPSEHGLSLEIEDGKQSNLRRLPQTLSGGESFVVSLALALGLAEIANNGKAIDSLFLDEGFGNLDAEALYLAMSTLESFKTYGKTVGVISHVEGVKKRIKTQIELVKKPNGHSELKLVA